MLETYKTTAENAQLYLVILKCEDYASHRYVRENHIIRNDRQYHDVEDMVLYQIPPQPREKRGTRTAMQDRIRQNDHPLYIQLQNAARCVGNQSVLLKSITFENQCGIFASFVT